MKLVLDGKQGDAVDLPPYGVAVALDNRGRLPTLNHHRQIDERTP